MNTKDKKTISKLADIIEANPGCEISIDNDSWDITPKGGYDEGDDGMGNYLATSNNFPCQTDFYSAGHLYGAAITEAFIELLRRRGMVIIAGAV